VIVETLCWEEKRGRKSSATRAGGDSGSAEDREVRHGCRGVEERTLSRQVKSINFWKSVQKGKGCQGGSAASNWGGILPMLELGLQGPLWCA